MSPTVDWDDMALATEGFSGADLQALIYNAHLEVVHATLADKRSNADGKGNGKGKGKAKEMESSGDVEREQRIEYVVLGGDEESDKPRSRAEEAALQKRVISIAHTEMRRILTYQMLQLRTILANRAARRGRSEGEGTKEAVVAKQTVSVLLRVDFFSSLMLT